MAIKALPNRTGSSGNPSLDGWLDLIPQLIKSDTYTPTCTAVTNVDSCSGNASQYIRVGDVVTVSGSVSVDPTASGVATNIRISLPIPSNLTASSNVAGTAAPITGTANNVAVISGNVANKTADMDWSAGHTADRQYFFHFTYRII